MKTGEQPRYAVAREIIILVCILFLTFYVSGKFDLLEMLFEFTQTYEEWELDELIVTGVVASLVLMVFAVRRWIIIKRLQKQLAFQYKKLEKAHEEISRLHGIIPICSSCKKIRDDKGFWEQVENYVEKHSDASFTHSLCPDCMLEHYGNEPWFKGEMAED